MKLRTVLPILLAVALAAGAVKLGRDVLRSRDGNAVEEDNSALVVIAAYDFPVGHEIREKDIAMKKVPIGLIPANGLAESSLAVGRRTIGPVSQGQIMVESMLVTGAKTVTVPAGMRAVMIDVDDSGGLGALITPGVKVDVVATIVDDNTHQTVARTVLQNVTVSAIEKVDEKNRNGKRGVTLIVSPSQAEQVDLVFSRSRPRLVLRGGADEVAVDSQGITLSQITGQKVPTKTEDPDAQQKLEEMMEKFRNEMKAQPKETPKQAVPGHTIRVFRGGVETTEEFGVPTAPAPTEAQKDKENKNLAPSATTGQP